mgnify:CR=1 FL=1
MKTYFQPLALGALLLLSACGGGNKESKESEGKELPIVKVAQVSARPVDQIVEYTGTIEAEAKNNIAPQSPVRISKIYVEVGQQVFKGQKLVQMDIANLKQLQLQLQNQQLEFNRVDELYKVGGISKSEWDAAKTSLEVSQTSYNNLLENTSLLSPINGVVSARNYDDGDLYTAAEPVLTVEQIMPVKLFINVSESYYASVKKGAPVKVKLDVYPDEVFEGVVSLIYPTIDPVTRTFTVEIKIPNSSQRIRPGMFARATLNYGTETRVVVPDLAVVKQPGAGDRYVYVYKDGKVSYNMVKLGRRMGQEYELISGVENNAQVVIAGQSRLLNGMEVQLAK